jgi:flavin reductase (DIM6/NTAB) family NADH-FMN oxidoreductase RutF
MSIACSFFVSLSRSPPIYFFSLRRKAYVQNAAQHRDKYRYTTRIFDRCGYYFHGEASEECEMLSPFIL